MDDFRNFGGIRECSFFLTKINRLEFLQNEINKIWRRLVNIYQIALIANRFINFLFDKKRKSKLKKKKKKDEASGDMKIYESMQLLLSDIDEFKDTYQNKVLNLKEIQKPIKDEFETTEQFNKRYKVYEEKLESINDHNIKEKKRFDNMMKELKEKLINEKKNKIKEIIEVTKDSLIFPDIKISEYNADKEQFLIYINDYKHKLYIPLNEAKEFKNSFMNYDASIQVKLLMNNKKIHYHYVILIIYTPKHDIHIQLPDKPYDLPVKKYQKKFRYKYEINMI